MQSEMCHSRLRHSYWRFSDECTLHEWLDCTVCVDMVRAGIIVYHGPRDEVMCFFEGLGFQLPPRKGVADFLQEITSRKDQKVHSIF